MRFLVVFTPFLLVWLLLGCSIAVRRSFSVARTLAGERRIPREVAAIGAVLLVLFGWDAAQILSSDDDRFHFREGDVDLGERRALTEWIESNTPLDAVVASAEPAALFLATGRQGHYFWPDGDPYGLYYGPDRSAASFFVPPAPSEVHHVVGEVRARFPEVWERAGVDWFVEPVGLNESAYVFGRIARENPERFELRFETRGRRYRVYRFRRLDP
jgi:hypothetical protein